MIFPRNKLLEKPLQSKDNHRETNVDDREELCKTTEIVELFYAFGYTEDVDSLVSSFKNKSISFQIYEMQKGIQ